MIHPKNIMDYHTLIDVISAGIPFSPFSPNGNRYRERVLYCKQVSSLPIDSKGKYLMSNGTYNAVKTDKGWHYIKSSQMKKCGNLWMLLIDDLIERPTWDEREVGQVGRPVGTYRKALVRV